MNLMDDDQNIMTPEPLEDYSPPDKRFPWTAVIIGVAALVVVIVAAAIIWTVVRNSSNRANPVVPEATSWEKPTKGPEQVVNAFYLAISQGDSTEAARYMDPRKPGLDPRATLLDTAQKIVGSVVPGDAKLQFQDLTYQTVSAQEDQAQVRVVGKLVLVAPDTALDQMKLTWAYTHQLIKLEGNWYIIF